MKAVLYRLRHTEMTSITLLQTHLLYGILFSNTMDMLGSQQIKVMKPSKTPAGNHLP